MSNEKHETVADNVSVNHQFREVAKMIPHEEVDVSKMETTTTTCEKSSSVVNAAAMRVAASSCDEMGHSMVAAMLRQAADDIDRNEKMRKKVDLYNKTFRKICGCLNKGIEVGARVHMVDGSSTSFISDCGALPIIFEIAKIIEDTVKKDEE